MSGWMYNFQIGGIHVYKSLGFLKVFIWVHQSKQGSMQRLSTVFRFLFPLHNYVQPCLCVGLSHELPNEYLHVCGCNMRNHSKCRVVFMLLPGVVCVFVLPGPPAVSFAQYLRQIAVAL